MMSDDDVRVVLTIQDIPAFRFSLAAVFVDLGVGIVRVYLDAEMVVCVNDFHQEGKFRPIHIAEQFPVLVPQLS